MAMHKSVKEFAFRLKNTNSVKDKDVRQIIDEYFSHMAEANHILSTGGFVGATIEEGSSHNEQNQKIIDALAASEKFERFPGVEQSNG